MNPSPRISVIVPNFNGAATLEQCLTRIFESDHDAFEVVVVDDASTDNSRDIVRRFPCKLIELGRRSGTGRARTTGARNSKGEILFFTDSDCLLLPNTLRRAEEAVRRMGERTVIGGTYTAIPYDRDFFSLFQSVFINYSELRNAACADYVAGHAMALSARVFWKTGGFPDNRLPILEDVEYSHRLRRMGYRLVIRPDILVQHVFNFNFFRSLRNGWRKSFYWTRYSLANRDLCADSGTASRNLKITVGMHALCFTVLLFQAVMPPAWIACLVGAAAASVLWHNRNLLRAFRQAAGTRRAGLLSIYYAAIYPFCIELGGVMGYLAHLRERLAARTVRCSLIPAPVPARAGSSEARGRPVVSSR